MPATASRLPNPSKCHATCAWCCESFDTIVDLIDHVDAGHLPAVRSNAEHARAA